MKTILILLSLFTALSSYAMKEWKKILNEEKKIEPRISAPEGTNSNFNEPPSFQAFNGELIEEHLATQPISVLGSEIIHINAFSRRAAHDPYSIPDDIGVIGKNRLLIFHIQHPYAHRIVAKVSQVNDINEQAVVFGEKAEERTKEVSLKLDKNKQAEYVLAKLGSRTACNHYLDVEVYDLNNNLLCTKRQIIEVRAHKYESEKFKTAAGQKRENKSGKKPRAKKCRL